MLSAFVKSASLLRPDIDHATLACRFLDYPALFIPLPKHASKATSRKTPVSYVAVHKGKAATLHDSIAQLRLLLAQVRK